MISTSINNYSTTSHLIDNTNEVNTLINKANNEGKSLVTDIQNSTWDTPDFPERLKNYVNSLWSLIKHHSENLTYENYSNHTINANIIHSKFKSDTIFHRLVFSSFVNDSPGLKILDNLIVKGLLKESQKNILTQQLSPIQDVNNIITITLQNLWLNDRGIKAEEPFDTENPDDRLKLRNLKMMIENEIDFRNTKVIYQAFAAKTRAS